MQPLWMEPNTMNGNPDRGSHGYALLIAIIAINIMAIFGLMARSLWKTEIQRDLEEELLFRAHQYTQAIENFRNQNSNLYPPDFRVLVEKKFLRRLYPEPFNPNGKWNLVMKNFDGSENSLLIVPEDQISNYSANSSLIGVCPTSTLEGFREYRKKKRYSEWAIYVGENLEEEMPELVFITQK